MNSGGKDGFDFDDVDEDFMEIRTTNGEIIAKRPHKKSDALYDPQLLEELEDVFHDAHDHIELSFTQSSLLTGG